MKAIILMSMFAFSFGVKAQTFSEWFQQNSTQKKYLLQQIAALKVYAGYLQKGYNIAREGLSNINGFAKGEFYLHDDYFRSLKTVNPVVKNDKRVSGIISLQNRIIHSIHQHIRELNNSKAFTSKELDYIHRVSNNLLDNCNNTLDELTTIVSNDKLEMKDDERLKRIGALYKDMQDKYSFCQSFINDAKLLAASRIREQAEIKTERSLRGIDNLQ